MKDICTDSAAVNAELTRLRAIDREREKAHNQKFKGMLFALLNTNFQQIYEFLAQASLIASQRSLPLNELRRTDYYHHCKHVFLVIYVKLLSSSFSLCFLVFSASSGYVSI